MEKLGYLKAVSKKYGFEIEESDEEALEVIRVIAMIKNKTKIISSDIGKIAPRCVTENVDNKGNDNKSIWNVKTPRKRPKKTVEKNKHIKTIILWEVRTDLLAR